MLLIHGIGHRHQMWDPVIPALADHFDTVAIDLPGFGESDPLGDGDAPTPARLADRVELVMDELGWDSAHLVGNSLGGWLSLELARRGRATSVCALMPAGLWRSTGGTARVRRQVLFSVWVHGSRVRGAGFLLRRPLLRTVALFGLVGRPWRIPSVVAADDARNLATCDSTARCRHSRAPASAAETRSMSRSPWSTGAETRSSVQRRRTSTGCRPSPPSSSTSIWGTFPRGTILISWQL
ncbi:alpha/beta fold hydrolase [Rhodococcus sp. BP-241]|uniref:alpha/beta fold hydrolase n=1 Tax=Rhodococcus sp. BP-241 TaxID=2739441 RepID=UPI0035AC0F54